MSEIDKLLISVGIDEGSNLDELYQMLKQLETTGKIELEIPDMITQRQFARLGTRITNLSNKLKPLIEKFPEIEPSIRTMFKEIIVQKIDEILKIVERSLKEGFGKDIKSILKSIEEQTIREPVLEILEIVRKIRGQFQTFQARLAMQMRREFDKIDINGQIVALEENLKGFLNIEDLYEDINLTNENIIELKNRINNVLGIIEGLSKNLEEIKTESPELEEIKTQMRLLQVGVNETVKIGMFNKIVDQLSELRDRSIKMFEEVETDYNIMQYDVRKIFSRLTSMKLPITIIRDTVSNTIKKRFEEIAKKWQEKITIHFSPEVYNDIGTIVKNKLGEFKDKLDDNLKGIIDPRLEMIEDFLNIEQKGIESIWKAPGVKTMGTHEWQTSLSGLFRDLVREMTTMSTEAMTKSIKSFKRRGMARHIGGMGPRELKQLGDFLGLDIPKTRGPEAAERKLEVVVNKIHKLQMEIVDIVGGTKIDVKKLTKENIPDKNIKKDEENKG